jgi:hypothetical protein
MHVHNPLGVKHFHEVLAGTVHECSLTSRIGRVREFWQRQHRFDTIEIHGTGSSFWGYDNPEFCEESGACQ